MVCLDSSSQGLGLFFLGTSSWGVQLCCVTLSSSPLSPHLHHCHLPFTMHTINIFPMNVICAFRFSRRKKIHAALLSKFWPFNVLLSDRKFTYISHIQLWFTPREFRKFISIGCYHSQQKKSSLIAWNSFSAKRTPQPHSQSCLLQPSRGSY